MPQKISCSKCGFVLYEDEELIQPVEILRKYEFRCPRCVSTLEVQNVKVLKALHA
jgi:predicted nucleic-acid-binding Zn-ribbon protein